MCATLFFFGMCLDVLGGPLHRCIVYLLLTDTGKVAPKLLVNVDEHGMSDQGIVCMSVRRCFARADGVPETEVLDDDGDVHPKVSLFRAELKRWLDLCIGELLQSIKMTRLLEDKFKRCGSECFVSVCAALAFTGSMEEVTRLASWIGWIRKNTSGNVLRMWKSGERPYG